MTYFVGIDIAKRKHDCFIMNHHGEVIRDSFSFANDRSGFTSLLEVLNQLETSQAIRIGLEATGHYGMNLKVFLESHGFSFMEFNPMLVKRFSLATTLRKTKTDKVDAKRLAWYTASVEFKPYPNKSYHIKNLKSLTRFRDSLVKHRSLQLVTLTNVLDRIFPEFKPFFKNSLTSKTCMYFLDHYGTPSKMARMNQESYAKISSQLRRTISYAKFIELKMLAKNTVGLEDPILTFQLQLALDAYHFAQTQVEAIENCITDEFLQVHTHIHSIKGIGLQSAACIFAEYAPFERFDSADQLLAFAGLEPSRHQSGSVDTKGYMVKHGSPYLRQALMNVAESSLIHNPVLYDFYLKKRNEGKHHRVALSHVAKRLVRIIFHLEKNNCNFDLSKMR